MAKHPLLQKKASSPTGEAKTREDLNTNLENARTMRRAKAPAWNVTIRDKKDQTRVEQVESGSNYKSVERKVTPRLRSGESIQSITVAAKKASEEKEPGSGNFLTEKEIRVAYDQGVKEGRFVETAEGIKDTKDGTFLPWSPEESQRWNQEIEQEKVDREGTGDYDFYKADQGTPAGEEEWIAMKEMGIRGSAKNAVLSDYDRLQDLCLQFVQGTVSDNELVAACEDELGIDIRPLSAHLEEYDGGHVPANRHKQLAKKLVRSIADAQKKSLDSKADPADPGSPAEEEWIAMKEMGIQGAMHTGRRTTGIIPGRGMGEMEREHPGAVCSDCGRTVTNGEYSYGGSNCCKADVVAEEEYGKTGAVNQSGPRESVESLALQHKQHEGMCDLNNPICKAYVDMRIAYPGWWPGRVASVKPRSYKQAAREAGPMRAAVPEEYQNQVAAAFANRGLNDFTVSTSEFPHLVFFNFQTEAETQLALKIIRHDFAAQIAAGKGLWAGYSVDSEADEKLEELPPVTVPSGLPESEGQTLKRRINEVNEPLKPKMNSQKDAGKLLQFPGPKKPELETDAEWTCSYCSEPNYGGRRCLKCGRPTLDAHKSSAEAKEDELWDEFRNHAVHKPPLRGMRPAIWENMLGTVYALSPERECKYFDYNYDEAVRFTGYPDRAGHVRVAKVPPNGSRQWIQSGATEQSPRPGKLVWWVMDQGKVAFGKKHMTPEDYRLMKEYAELDPPPQETFDEWAEKQRAADSRSVPEQGRLNLSAKLLRKAKKEQFPGQNAREKKYRELLHLHHVTYGKPLKEAVEIALKESGLDR